MQVWSFRGILDFGDLEIESAEPMRIVSVSYLVASLGKEEINEAIPRIWGGKSYMEKRGR